MKHRTLLTVFPILAAFALSACGQGIDITITVVDEEGTPMEGAYVRTGYTLRDGSDRIIEAHTDAGGRVYFKAHPPGYQYLKALVRHEGYYDSYAQFSITQPTQGGYLKQSDTDTTFTLREIRDPLPMYVRRLDTRIPGFGGEPTGYDLEKMDWVAPHGEGVRGDIYMRLHGQIDNRQKWDVQLTISFPGDGDGLVVLEEPPYPESAFKALRMAPESGYVSEWVLRSRRISGEAARAAGVSPTACSLAPF